MKSEKIVKFLNLASIFIIAITVIVLAYRYAPIQATAKSDEPTELSLAPFSGEPVLKFVLATDCQYCEKSYEFYRALLSSRIDKEFKAVAVFPEDPSLTREFLRMRGLAFDEIEQASYAELGVAGTPSLLLMNSDGREVGRWIGLQSNELQARIARILQVDKIFAAAAYGENIRTKYYAGLEKVPTMTVATFKELSRRDSLTVIDTRSPERYREDHVLGSINIPFEDLDSESIARIPHEKPMAILCEYSDPMVCRKEGAPDVNNSNCFLAGSLLVANGLEDVSVLSATAVELRTDSLTVSTAGGGAPGHLLTSPQAE